MSTQPSSDLDRTDQLPVLDVEAYEASLTESQKGLGRTDTWAVTALQDMDELAEATRKERRPAHRALPRPKAAELTANVERILHRIADLEAEITAAHEANAVLQKRSKAIESERDQQVQRVRTLEADNARLGEHRVLAESKVDSLERQLGEQAHRAKLEIEDLRSLHRAEVERRAEDVAALEKVITDEKASNAKLAQQLAAKLKDCERLAVVVDDNLRESQSLLQEREGIIAQRDQQIAAIEGELRGAVDELESERQRLSAAMTAVAAAEPQRVEMEERAQELAAQLQTSRDEQSLMAGQLGKLRARIKSLTEQIFSRDNEIAALQEDLAVHSEALDAIRRDVNRINGGDDVQAAPDVEHMLESLDHEGESIMLDRRSYTIGRTSENDICLPSQKVSRLHARLLVGPTGVIIEDAGSTNGCYVNGEQVHHQLMHDGDVLELGDVRYCLRTRSASDTSVRDRTLPSLVAVGPPSTALAPINA